MEFLDLPLREQAAAIAAGEADPAELLDAALARIEERNPAINAIVETFPERSREMLAAAPARPAARRPGRDQGRVAAALAGPALRRRRTCWPAAAPGESGPYRALRDAGAVIVGVGNMHELGAGSTGNVSVYGPARNPWDTERCPGGSSSGPAAAVAARLVAGAVGADGIGSIRYPAAYCGLTGLKPTFGRSAMDGHHMAGGHDHDRLRPALRRRRRLPPARLGVLFGEELRGRRRRRPADRGRPRRRLRGRRRRRSARPARRRSRRCARRPAARSREVELRGPASRGAGDGPDRQHRGASAASPPSGSTRSSPELSPIGRGAAQVPDAAAGRRDRPRRARVRTLMRRRAGRRSSSEVDVLAWPTVAGAGAAAGGAAGRAALGHLHRRPGQRPRRRPRQPRPASRRSASRSGSSSDGLPIAPAAAGGLGPRRAAARRRRGAGAGQRPPLGRRAAAARR